VRLPGDLGGGVRERGEWEKGKGDTREERVSYGGGKAVGNKGGRMVNRWGRRGAGGVA